MAFLRKWDIEDNKAFLVWYDIPTHPRIVVPFYADGSGSPLLPQHICVILSFVNPIHCTWKGNLQKWRPTVIERAHWDQSPLCTVIVSVDQVDWQIMHICKQPLRHGHTYHSLPLCFCVSQRQIHTLFHLISPSSFKEGSGVTRKAGINLRKHQTAVLSTQITSPSAPGAKGRVCKCVQVKHMCTSVWMHRCLRWTKQVNTTLCSRRKLTLKFKINQKIIEDRKSE